jgi:hypothetical protein
MFSGKRFALVAGLALSLIFPMQSPAIADYTTEDYTTDKNTVENTLLPEQEMFWLTEPFKNAAEIAQKPVYYSFGPDVFNVIGLSSIQASETTNGVTASYWCEGWSDEKCLKPGNRLLASMFLPPCGEVASSGCILGGQIKTQSGTEEFRLLRILDSSVDSRDRASHANEQIVQTTSFPMLPEHNIPAGSTESLWTSNGMGHSAGSDTYLISANVTVQVDVNQSRKLVNPRFSNLKVFVTPYVQVSGSFRGGYFVTEIEAGLPKAFTRGHVFRATDFLDRPGGCIWMENGLCGLAAAFNPNDEISLSIVTPNQLSGWLQGRLKDADVKISKFDNQSKLLSVTAKSIEVQVSGHYFNPGEFPQFPHTPPALGYQWSSASGPRGGTQAFKLFSNQLGDKAIGRASVWGFSTRVMTGTGFDSCKTSEPRLEGFISTDAMAFDNEIPTYKKGALSYQVGGLHYNHDGSVFKGSYDFIMRSDTARCIYGFTKAPVQVAVTVTDVNGVQSASTSSVSESGGWLRIRARDFTFSTPTITAKITQKLSASVKNDKISQKSLAKIAKVSIGKKDKVTISVSGGNKKFAKVTSGNVSFKKNGTYQVKIKVKHYKGTTETATISVKVK